MGYRMRLNPTSLKCVAVLILLTVTVLAAAQQPSRIPRIGYVLPTAPTWAQASLSQTVHGFILGMRDHGYEEGRDFLMETRSALGHPERMADLTAEQKHEISHRGKVLRAFSEYLAGLLGNT